MKERKNERKKEVTEVKEWIGKGGKEERKKNKKERKKERKKARKKEKCYSGWANYKLLKNRDHF